MELGPIPPVHDFSGARELPADFQLSAVPEINGAAQSGTGRRSGERKKTAAPAPADADELTLAGESETISEQPAETPDHSINIFA